MALNKYKRNQLLMKYEGWCSKHHLSSDLFDIEANIDTSLSYFENSNIIEDKLRVLLDNGNLIKQQKKQEEMRKEQEFQEKRKGQETDLKKIFSKPRIIAIISDVNEGKSMTGYYLISYLNKNFDYSLYSYGLRAKVNGIKINSIEELEKIRNSIIFLDEFIELFNLDDKKNKRNIEKSLRLINHNNNILILIGVPDNFKKFISAKIDIVFYKKTTLNDFINGSKVKYDCLNYRGSEMGSSILNINIDEVLIWNGEHYNKIKIPYLKEFDTKKDNELILKKKHTSFRSKKSGNQLKKNVEKKKSAENGGMKNEDDNRNE